MSLPGFYAFVELEQLISVITTQDDFRKEVIVTQAKERTGKLFDAPIYYLVKLITKSLFLLYSLIMLVLQYLNKANKLIVKY